MIFKFQNIDVEIIEDINKYLLFELYSTGMALGQIKWNGHHSHQSPRKERIDKCVGNAGIEPINYYGHIYLNESQLYDLMLEMRTNKVKPFRRWVAKEVSPYIKERGSYVTAFSAMQGGEII